MTLTRITKKKNKMSQSSRPKGSSLLKFGFSLKSKEDPDAEIDKKRKRREEAQKKYEAKRPARTFREEWVDSYPGLLFNSESNSMRCAFCSTPEVKHLANPNSAFSQDEGSTSIKLESVKFHWSSRSHEKCTAAVHRRRAAAGQHEPQRGPMDHILQKLGQNNMDILQKLFNTIYFIMQKELPFATLPGLINLQKKNGSDLKQLLSYSSDNACKRIGKVIAEELRERQLQRIRDAKFLSITYDGATDCSVTELEIVYCRIVEAGVPLSFYLKLIDVEHAHAEGVYNGINEAFVALGIPEWKQKVVGAGSDGASVNIGVNNSVKTRLRENHPYICVIHCVAHRLELGVLQAIKATPKMIETQDLLNRLHKNYHYSPKALRELRLIAEAMEEKVLKPTRLSGTRWMPHISKALTTLLKSYPVILAHFEHVREARVATAEVQGRAVWIVRKLRDHSFLQYLFFMQDLLNIISILSLKFQADSITTSGVVSALETANLQLIELRNGPGPKLAEFQQQIQGQTYKGVELTNFQPDQEYGFGPACELVRNHINNVIENPRDGTWAIIMASRVFETAEWPRDREGLAAFGNDQLQTLVDHFRPILERNNCNFDDLRREWLELKAHISTRAPANRPLPQLPTLLREPGLDGRFGNIFMIVELVLTLPVSSSNCERGFSAVKRIKTDWRASLSTSVLDWLLLVSLEGESLDDYNAIRAMNRWWNGAQRARRPHFQQADAVLDQNNNDEDELLNYFLAQNDNGDAH